MSNAQPNGRQTDLEVAIIGAGFSGLYMLYRARDILGLKAQVFESGEDVGGTWYWNRYPGARCDSESYYYSYSFSKELEQEWEWSSRYPRQPEILRYLRHVADRFDLRKDIHFQTRIVETIYDESRNLWALSTNTGETATARFVVAATGCLSQPNAPDFPGLSEFSGDWYHTGQWPHEGVDFSGKRVGIIGTGSTSIQATPVIAAEAAHLTVFQRTPNYTIPARNAPLEPEEAQSIKANYAEIRARCRDSGGGFPFQVSERPALEASAQERERIYERYWELGGFRFLACTFSDLTEDEAANETAAEFVRQKIRRIVLDEETAELLVPTDHPYGTKRPPIDTNYYETFNRDNVALVDVRSNPIVAITPNGLRTSAGEFALDAIVFATGFDAMTGALLKMGIRGRDGRSLEDAWHEGPKSYLGLQVAGFPNLFTVTGPGSPSVLTNMPVAIEQHIEWISDCIEHLKNFGKSTIEATADAQENWVEHVREEGEKTLYPKANSWYVGANIPGKSRVFMPYVAGLDVYRNHCAEIVEQNYRGFDIA